MKSLVKKLTAVCLCAGMLAVSAPRTLAASSEEDAIADLNERYEQLEKEAEALQEKIDNAQTEKAKQEAIKDKTTQEISIIRDQIAVLEEKIVALETEIANKEAEIDGLEESIAENYELFKSRMRAMYMSENTSVISLVLGADSFGDFLSSSEYLKRVAEHDQDLLDELEQTLANVEDAKAAVEADREELSGTKTEVEQKKQQLDAKLNATISEIQNISQMEQEFLADLEAKQQEMKEAQEEIDRIYASMESSGEYVGGGFMYPVPGYTYISSYYGWRFNGTDFHTGVDFTGSNVNGKSVVASNSGTVSFTKSTYTPGVGYGKYIIVDHGGGYSTLYGHLSSINVSVGDYVSKGENIGNVGSTGWSTGPHLHFEIRIDGQHTNPLPYLQG